MTLDEDALKNILTEPKNALTKQYRKLFDMEGVDLKFTDEALTAIAIKAIARKTGARGLRAIMEEALMDLMYEIPGAENVNEVIITGDVINGKAEAVLTNETPGKKAKKS